MRINKCLVKLMITSEFTFSPKQGLALTFYKNANLNILW